MEIARIEVIIRLLTILGAVVAFSWGVFKYFEDNKNLVESRRIEATKPFLERQLKLYTEATQVASTIANTEDSPERRAAEERFYLLYWGELVMVENEGVEAAMVAFEKGLNDKVPAKQLKDLSFNLARACRNSLALSWGIKEWRSHYDRKSEEQN